MNTITQCLRRGALDEETADKMKQLARAKKEIAIRDIAYANGSYEKGNGTGGFIGRSKEETLNLVARYGT